jgi:hypothetical protein
MLSEFERRAWEQRGTCEQHKPEMACKVVLDNIARGELTNVKHITVIVVQDHNGGDFIGTYHAGSLSELAIEGALGRAIRIGSENKEN